MPKKKTTSLKKETTDFTARFMMWMAASILFFTFVYIFCITFIEIPKSNQRFADTIIGFLVGTLAGTVINYFYGSSKSSNDKNKTLEILSTLQNKLNEAVDETREGIDSESVDEQGEATEEPAPTGKASIDVTQQTGSDYDARTLGDKGKNDEEVYANEQDLKKANS